MKACAICVLKAQGVLKPEDYVLPQYFMLDATLAPVPTAKADDIFLMFPEEETDEYKLAPTAGGVVGTLKNIFRTLGLYPSNEQKPEVEKSKQLAREKRKTTLRD